MRPHSRGDRYAVYDDVLAPNELGALLTASSELATRSTLSTINRFHDGLSCQGPGPTESPR